MAKTIMTSQQGHTIEIYTSVLGQNFYVYALGKSSLHWCLLFSCSLLSWLVSSSPSTYPFIPLLQSKESVTDSVTDWNSQSIFRLLVLQLCDETSQFVHVLDCSLFLCAFKSDIVTHTTVAHIQLDQAYGHTIVISFHRSLWLPRAKCQWHCICKCQWSLYVH